MESGKHLDASTETRGRATAGDGCFRWYPRRHLRTQSIPVHAPLLAIIFDFAASALPCIRGHARWQLESRSTRVPVPSLRALGGPTEFLEQLCGVTTKFTSRLGHAHAYGVRGGDPTERYSPS
jgi:hypothetical protein